MAGTESHSSFSDPTCGVFGVIFSAAKIEQKYVGVGVMKPNDSDPLDSESSRLNHRIAK